MGSFYLPFYIISIVVKMIIYAPYKSETVSHSCRK